VEDFEIRSPSEKAPVDREEVKRDAENRRRKRRRRIGPPSEVEAMLEEEESSAVNPEAMANAGSGPERTYEENGEVPDEPAPVEPPHGEPAGEPPVAAAPVEPPSEPAPPPDTKIAEEHPPEVPPGLVGASKPEG
jgi:hypothetical protein